MNNIKYTEGDIDKYQQVVKYQQYKKPDIFSANICFQKKANN